MAVYQVSIHDLRDEITVLITEAKNRREALVKALEAKPGLTDVASVYVILIADAVLL